MVPTVASGPLTRASRSRRARHAIALLAAGCLLTGTLAATAGPAQAAPVGSPHPAVASRQPAPAGRPDLGPNVYVFTPSMPQSAIQASVDAIAGQQLANQFGRQRYALLFEPGSYGTPTDPLIFQVGYYTEVAGLGRSPDDVTIHGSIDVYNQCLPAAPGTTNCTALVNFWRSMSNLTIDVAGGSGCQANTEFWAVSQAAPMRRVQVVGNFSLMDFCSAGPQFASGGFIADSVFSGGGIVNGSQQQFLVRNSSLDGWSNGVWNQVFAGDAGAPAQSFGVAGGAGPYTTLATNPVTQEQPYLYTDAGGRLAVFVPAVRHDSAGPSWSGGSTAGSSVPLTRFFIADPNTPVPAINLALERGADLLLTPGVYDLGQTIRISRANTVVLGLGFATLVPRHGIEAMRVAGVPGVKLSGMIFDAGPVNSHVLLQVGSRGHRQSGSADPTLIQDVFFRIGGATPGRATDSLVVDSSNVILDDIWAWRADHGNGVGWTDNRAQTGVIVNGDDVTAYGLFVEHYQNFEVIWNGQHGTDVFFQNEMPYDVPDQAGWMSSRTVDGYAAFLVTPRVKTFTGYGMGSYSFFNQGVDIHARQAFQVPRRPGIRLHDLLTVFLNASGGIDSVVDGVGAAVSAANHGPSDVISFP